MEYLVTFLLRPGIEEVDRVSLWLREWLRCSG